MWDNTRQCQEVRLSKLDIRAIKARLKAATPGRWELTDYPPPVAVRVPEADICYFSLLDSGNEAPNAHANAILIAHAPEDLAALVERVEELELLLEELYHNTTFASSEEEPASGRGPSEPAGGEAWERLKRLVQSVKSRTSQALKEEKGAGEGKGNRK